MKWLYFLIYSINPLHAARQRSLLWVMSSAVKSGAPLAGLVRGSVQTSLAPLWRRLVRRLANQLEQGTPIDTALIRERVAVTDSALMTIRVGAACGTANESLEAAAEAASRRHSLSSSAMGFWGYLWASLIALLCMSLISFNVLAAYNSIFEGFGVEISPIHESLNESGSAWAVFAGVGFILAFLVLWVFFPLAWHASRGLPFYQGRMIPKSWQLRLASCDVLLNIGVSTKQALNITDCLRAVAEFHPQETVRSAMSSIVERHQQGVPIGAAFHRERVLTEPEGRLIDASSQTGNLSWALDFTARRIESRIQRQVDLFVAIARPAFIGIFAGVVLFWGYVLFAPLIQLIGGLG